MTADCPPFFGDKCIGTQGINPAINTIGIIYNSLSIIATIFVFICHGKIDKDLSNGQIDLKTNTIVSIAVLL